MIKLLIINYITLQNVFTVFMIKIKMQLPHFLIVNLGVQTCEQRRCGIVDQGRQIMLVWQTDPIFFGYHNLNKISLN